MISMFAGGLAVGSAVLFILVIHGLHTGTWRATAIVTAAAILFVGTVGAVAAAFAIQFERAKTP